MEVDRDQLTTTRTPALPKKEYCFDLKLGESNVETYPEFSWKDLVKEAQQREVTQRAGDGKPTLNPYASDDEENLKALAAKFEQKYKNEGVTKEKRRKRRAEDYIDRGAGYDETDSFIDNSEIYDELVPADMQPVHGGFYINSGRLDFKEADVSDCDVDEEIEEHRQSKGTALFKSIPDKKTGPVPLKGGGVKKRRVSITGEQVGGKVTKVRKKSESPKGSGSSSPIRPASKSRTITISSQSDSSSSDSSGSSATSTSDTEKDEEVPVKPKAQLPVQTPPQPPPPVASTSGSSTQAPRRLKVKNVPLNPKLHGGPLPQKEQIPKTSGLLPPNPSKKSTSLLSNREIFGSLKPSLSGLNIPTGLSATSILPATVPASSTPPLKLSFPSSPKSGGVVGVPQSILPPKPKVRRRVTDRQQVPGNLVKKPGMLMATSPSTVSPVRKRQKLDPLAGSARQVLGLAVGKKPRKPRVSSLLRNPSSSAASTNQRTPILTPEQQLQALQQFQQMNSSLALQFLPMLGQGGLPALQNLPVLSKQQNHPEQRKLKPNLAGVELLKNLASFQSQVGTGVTVSEVKKTKPHVPSPSSNMATISPRSNTPPSRLSNSSPINIPRIIPSSITVTASNVRNHQQQHQRSTTTVGNSTVSPSNSTFSATPPTISPNVQSVPNKTFTAFGVSTLLSKNFNNNGNSAGK